MQNLTPQRYNQPPTLSPVGIAAYPQASDNFQEDEQSSRKRSRPGGYPANGPNFSRTTENDKRKVCDRHEYKYEIVIFNTL